MPQYDVFDMFKGALGESTRKTRRALLGSGFFGSVMVWGQLIPKELYGMNFQDTPTQILVPVVAVVMYFLVTFIMYSVPELVGWVTLYRRWTTGAGDHILKTRIRYFAVLRILWEVCLPILLGIAAVIYILRNGILAQ